MRKVLGEVIDLDSIHRVVAYEVSLFFDDKTKLDEIDMLYHALYKKMERINKDIRIEKPSTKLLTLHLPQVIYTIGENDNPTRTEIANNMQQLQPKLIDKITIEFWSSIQTGLLIKIGLK